MSAPNTNLDKQKRWHRGPLVGMAAVLCFVAVLLTAYLVFLADDGKTPAQTAPDVNGATGETSPPPAPAPTGTQVPAN